ncbi:MAG: adenylate kinase [Clostridia bacterium]|nr:adenylate kinase [Clostridia bacterium]
MIILIAGASHTGKTLLAQALLEKYRYPYISIDHLKMGLIRSGKTTLTVFDDNELTAYLWPIVREIIKTAVENNQNLIIEGCYIPFDWASSFEEHYLKQIRAFWLIMTTSYIQTHFDEILSHACEIEQRIDDSSCTKQWLIEENERNFDGCCRFGCNYILIDKKYEIGEISWLT